MTNDALRALLQEVRTIAVVGPNAKGLHLGGYSSDPGRGVDILQGIRDKAGPGIRTRVMASASESAVSAPAAV